MDSKMREQFLRMQRSLHGPAWRNRSAQVIARQSDRTAVRTWDPLTIETAKYYALRADGADGLIRAAKKYPHHAQAILLNADGAKTDVLKLLILADAPTAAIAVRVGVEPAVVDVWERLFFDVRDLRNAVGWMSGRVIDAECEAGNTALAARMKLALTAGIDGVNAILTLDEGVPVDEAERLFQRRLKLDLKFDEALSMPFTSERSRLAFIKSYVDLRCSEKRLAFAEKQLAARCAAALDRFELSKLRLEASKERAATKAKELSDKAEQRRLQADRVAAATEKQELQRQARRAEQKAAAGRVAQPLLSRPVSPKPQPAPLPVSRPVSPVSPVSPVPVTVSVTVTEAKKVPDSSATQYDFQTDLSGGALADEVLGLELAIQRGVS